MLRPREASQYRVRSHLQCWITHPFLARVAELFRVLSANQRAALLVCCCSGADCYCWCSVPAFGLVFTASFASPRFPLSTFCPSVTGDLKRVRNCSVRGFWQFAAIIWVWFSVHLSQSLPAWTVQPVWSTCLVRLLNWMNALVEDARSLLRTLQN